MLVKEIILKIYGQKCCLDSSNKYKTSVKITLGYKIFSNILTSIKYDEI